MKILAAADFIFPDHEGGAGRVAWETCKALRVMGHDVRVWCLGEPGKPLQEDIEGLGVWRLEHPKFRGSAPGVLSLRGAASLSLDAVLRGFEPDVVIAHSPLAAWLAQRHGALGRKPFVYFYNSSWPKEYRVDHPTGILSWAGAAVRRRMERQVLARSDRFAVLSSVTRAELLREGVPDERIAVVPAGTDYGRFLPGDKARARRELGLGPGPVLLTVRNLRRRMGLGMLLEAAGTLRNERPGLRVVIAGIGPMESELKRRSVDSGLSDCVLFAGRVPDADLPAYYRAADVFVLPSRELENFGLVLLEAAACGTPCVGTPVGGIPEVLSYFDPGWVAPEASAAGLVLAIRSVLAGPLDPVGLRGKAMARYTWDFCARGLLALAADSGRRRVLSLITRLDVGGSSEIAILSAQGLRRMGCDVLLAAGPSPGSSAEPAVGCREIPALRRDVHPLKDAAAFVQILRLLRAWRPHILHTHSSKAGILGRWAAFLHNVFHRDGIRIVHTPHGHVFYGYFGPAKTAVFTMAERMSAAVSDRLVAISSGEMRESLERGVGEPSQWVVIHSGVKLEEPGLAVAEAKARLSGSFGVPPDAAVVGTVVRLEPVKGTDVLLKAAPEILAAFPQKRVAFLVIGDGPLREPLGRLSRDLGVSASVVFAGLQKDPAALMRAMDVYVQPSRNEGMGMALAQAQWLRLPAVASRVCGIPDVVQDGKTGILVPPDDPAALARAVGTLLRDADLRARLGAAGKKWVSRVDDTGYPAFSVEAMIERLDRLYQDL